MILLSFEMGDIENETANMKENNSAFLGVWQIWKPSSVDRFMNYLTNFLILVQSYYTGANYLNTTNHIQDGQLHQLMINMSMKSARYLTNILEISEGSLKTSLKDHLGRRMVKSQLVPNH